jgi:hypothetical protein
MTIDQSIGNYHDSSHTHLRKIGRATGPASYTTGGDPLLPAGLSLGRVEVLLFEPFENGTVIIFGRYNVTAQTVKFYDLAGNEIANATDLSLYSARFEAIGL